MTCRTSPTSSGSSAEVTSSNSMIFGRMAQARAMATRCCWPPESCDGIMILLVGEPDHVEKLGRARLGASLRLHAEHRDRRLDAVLQRGHVREEVEGLEHHADLGAHAADVGRCRPEPACRCAPCG